MKNKRLLTLALTAPLAITGCLDSSSTSAPAAQTLSALTVGATADFSSASMAIIDTDNYTATTELNATSSDMTISTYQDTIYLINRGEANITKYSVNAPTTPIWQCSTGAGSNPYQVIQTSNNQAYVLRYDSAEIWVIDPSISSSAQCNTQFKTAEIDLSSFDDDLPNMSHAVLVGNRLFVALQRLTGWTADKDAQIVVIDTQTQQLIDTDPAIEGIQAITLNSRNPKTMVYNADLNRIFVQSTGKFAAWDGSAPAEKGGIDVINPSDYSVTVFVDDSEIKQTWDIAIASATLGYFVSYEGWGDNTVYQFNPSALSISPTKVATSDLQNQAISTIATHNNQLWVGVSGGIQVFNETNGLVQTINTQMNPSRILFIEN